MIIGYISLASAVQSHPNPHFSFQLTVKIRLADSSKRMSGRPKVIVHEPDGFPLDNYGRYLYDHFVPGNQAHIFYSKNIQLSYDNRNRPCKLGPIELFGQQYNYDQVPFEFSYNIVF